ncbi:lysine biosynthesis protein LysX [Patescibacteria group bacterium]|nr:lysine biosynthesis protein LysX [Patescibacteria group bacterium]
MRIALIHSTIRGDEKLLIKAAKKRKIELVPVDIRKKILNPDTWKDKFDVVIERCISTTFGSHAVSFFESIGIPVINSMKVARVCEDKFATSLSLKRLKIPTVPFALVFTEEQAAKAIQQLGGYPVVLKPAKGSWGRLLAKINDRDALEAVLEQKMVLGTPPHKAFYIQKYVEKNGRDIRVTTVGNKVICAIYRVSTHWITNTSRGAKALRCKVDKELEKISVSASKAVGGGVLGIDVFETEDGYVVNEVNHTTEFKNVQAVTGVDVASVILSYCKEVSKHA